MTASFSGPFLSPEASIKKAINPDFVFTRRGEKLTKTPTLKWKIATFFIFSKEKNHFLVVGQLFCETSARL